MHLSILLENMCREGYEMTCSNPHVLLREIDGVRCEPMEEAVIDLPEEAVGTVIEKLGARKGELVDTRHIVYYSNVDCQQTSRLAQTADYMGSPSSSVGRGKRAARSSSQR